MWWEWILWTMSLWLIDIKILSVRYGLRNFYYEYFILFLVISDEVFCYIQHPDTAKFRAFWPGSDPELYFWILNRFRPFWHKACTGKVLGKDWKLDPNYVPYGIFYPSHYLDILSLPGTELAGCRTVQHSDIYKNVHPGKWTPCTSTLLLVKKTPCTLKLLVVERHLYVYTPYMVAGGVKTCCVKLTNLK